MSTSFQKGSQKFIEDIVVSFLQIPYALLFSVFLSGTPLHPEILHPLLLFPHPSVDEVLSPRLSISS